MIKKKLLLFVFSFCTIFLVGCEKVVDLTDEETQLIAEYAAELLLKYDINYEDRLDDGYQKAEELSSEELEKFINGETVTEVATVTEATTETVATEASTTESSTEKENATSADDSEDDVVTSDGEVAVGTESNIARIVGIEGADITFKQYSIVDKYPATDAQGEFIYLEASEGYQLLVLQFDVVNKTDSLLPISLIDSELDYRIVCNGSKAAKPMLTILMDDLGTLETNVEPNASQEAVLVFQVSDGMQQELQTMDLHVTYNNVDNVIKILQ
ncbi:MAG: hypothetical protein J6C01_02250 [Lachnospiraceae bacterium]|nr:hypothetical protein [Lachnospiraceae bacterium]